jgi:hypothetical protein
LGGRCPCESGEDGVDEAAVECGATEEHAVKDRPDREFVEHADVGVWVQVDAGDAALDHRRQRR